VIVFAESRQVAVWVGFLPEGCYATTDMHFMVLTTVHAVYREYRKPMNVSADAPVMSALRPHFGRSGLLI
jgi:hypothetical protein